MSEILRFCADVHLGKLACMLRMLGFDTFYKNDLSSEELYQIARNENRYLLSKSAYFKTFSDIDFYQIESSDPKQQVKDVVIQFNLFNLLNPFTRCLYCNQILEKKDKVEVENELLPQTKKDFSEFWKCTSCNRIYWKGSHYERMIKQIEEIHLRGKSLSISQLTIHHSLFAIHYSTIHS
jgi:uncharacterized protein